ncbi:MAG: aldo/keto reductase [Saccharofermentanales bacterium]|jgi:methylglyoxal reductase
MRYKKLGNSEIEISVVGLGAWAIGGDSNWGESDDNMSIRTIHEAYDLGITLVDTAPAYGLGHSEEVVGKALKGRRSDFVLETKCGLVWDGGDGSVLMSRDGVTLLRNLSAKSLRKQIEESLSRLDTDYIDIFVTHWQSIPPFKYAIEETMGALNEFVKEGKIRAIGISNVTPEEVDEYCKYGTISLIQQKFSMLDRTHEKTLMPKAKEHGLTFQAYSPLERGILTGKVTMDTPIKGIAKKGIKWFELENRAKVLAVLDKFEPICKKYNCSLTNLAIAWTAAQMDNMNVLCGARKVDQVADNAKGGDIVLEQVDLDFINNAVAPLIAE